MKTMQSALLVTLLVTASVSPLSAEVLFDLGSSWQWLHPQDGVDPAIADPDFNSANGGWLADAANFAAHYDGPAFQPAAPAPLGFGLIDYLLGITETDIGTPPTNQRFSAYFRKEFVVPADGFYLLELTALLDDGAVFYIDGLERLRVNVPQDLPDTYQLMATTAGNEGGLTTASFNGGLPFALAAGNHQLAVSVHQLFAASSDMAFDVRLEAMAPPLPDFGLAAPQSQDFEDIPLGARSLDRGTGGLAFTAPSSLDDRGVQDSTSTFPPPPDDGPPITVPGNRQLVITIAGTFVTDRVDVRSNTLGSRIEFDFRTHETGATSDWEDVDLVRFFVEGTVDGYNFESIPGGPPDQTYVGAPFLNRDVPNPQDQLKAFQLPNDGFTHFVLEVPAFVGAIRLGMERTGSTSDLEYLILDNLSITPIPVPEPSGRLLAGLGMAGAACVARRARRGRAPRAKRLARP